MILFLERKSIKKSFVFASKRLRFQGFAPGSGEKLLIKEQYEKILKSRRRFAAVRGLYGIPIGVMDSAEAGRRLCHTKNAGGTL